MKLKRRSKGVWNVEVGKGQEKQKNKSAPFLRTTHIKFMDGYVQDLKLEGSKLAGRYLDMQRFAGAGHVHFDNAESLCNLPGWKARQAAAGQ